MPPIEKNHFDDSQTKGRGYYRVIIMSPGIDNLIVFMIMRQMGISRITSKSWTKNEKRGTTITMYELQCCFGKIAKKKGKQINFTQRHKVGIPNWRTAIPGAPMDFLRSTTSSVITPCHMTETRS